MSIKKLFLIINPISGTDSKKGLDEKLVGKLAEAGYEVTTAFTTCRGDATRLAREAIASGYDGVLACGGDGTVNETARAMRGSHVPMGIIPAGSGNGLARHVAIPIDPMLSLDVIAEEHIARCDYGEADGLPFFCTFGMGFDAEVSHRFAASGKRGKMTYVKTCMEEFLNYKPQEYTISVDGAEPETYNAFLVACCNASQYGNNAFIAPHASITDGVLDLIIVKDPNFLSKLVLGFDMMAGLIHDGGSVHVVQGREFHIRRQHAGPVHLDGEPMTMGNEITVRCVPQELTLFTTAHKSPFRPILTPIAATLSDWKIAISRLFQ